MLGPASLTATVNPDGRIVLRWEAPDSLHWAAAERGSLAGDPTTRHRPRSDPTSSPPDSPSSPGNMSEMDLLESPEVCTSSTVNAQTFCPPETPLEGRKCPLGVYDSVYTGLAEPQADDLQRTWVDAEAQVRAWVPTSRVVKSTLTEKSEG